jgi:hypothetical protein
MIVTPPSDDELRDLLAEHAHRHPDKAAVTVVGDGGLPVRLPFLLGTPTGACELGEDVRPSSAFADLLASAIGLKAEPPDLGPRLARDVVLWPSPPTLAQWMARWPALPARISEALAQKLAIKDSCLEEPSYDEEPPAAIAAAIAADSRTTWRRLRPPGAVFAAAIRPPAPQPYRIFQDALKKAKADPWPVVRDGACAGLSVVVDEGGKVVDAATVMKRWPGLAALVIAEVRLLAGAGAEVQLGNW